MSYTASLKRSIIGYSIIIILLLLVAQTSSYHVYRLRWGENARIELHGQFVTIDGTQLNLREPIMDLDTSSDLVIRIYDTQGHYINITYSKTLTLAEKTRIGTSVGDKAEYSGYQIIVIGNNYVAVGARRYLHNVNLSNAVLTVDWSDVPDNLGGPLIIVLSGSPIGDPRLQIPDYNATDTGLVESLGSIWYLFSLVSPAFFVFVNLVAASIDIVWRVIQFVFMYVGMALAVAQEYVLPYLGLFIGLYFFGTLGMAIASIPKQGFMALVEWGRLWYSHIMALVRFIKMLAEWMIKAIQVLVNLISSILPI